MEHFGLFQMERSQFAHKYFVCQPHLLHKGMAEVKAQSRRNSFVMKFDAHMQYLYTFGTAKKIAEEKGANRVKSINRFLSIQLKLFSCIFVYGWPKNNANKINAPGASKVIFLCSNKVNSQVNQQISLYEVTQDGACF